MHKFILFIKEFKIYKKENQREALASFSKKQLLIFSLAVFIMFILVVLMLSRINQAFMVSVPIKGGSLTEGIIGSPTLINPVIAVSDADKDLTNIIYSGLMRKDQNDELIPDLAESYEISEDGKNYTFIIRENAFFHNGMKVTADDVIFTIEKIKDPIVKSSRKLNWEGISVNKTDEKTVIFTLSQPYISFLNNTTIGILPSVLWKNVNVNEFNLSLLNTNKAIGSGPYKIQSISKDKDGFVKKISLVRFNKFTLGKPLIKKINFIFFTNQKDLTKALLNKTIDQAGSINSENIINFKNKDRYGIQTATLPRIFGIFFNSNNNKIFNDPVLINSLNKAINKQEIIDQVLGGFGSIVENPIPEKMVSREEKDVLYNNNTIDEVNEMLEKAGWLKAEDGIRIKSGTKKEDPTLRLSFSLITGDTPELKQATLLIKEQLVKVGIEVDTSKIYETGQLNQLIRSREYEALFFGQGINNESDLYSFWHSTQRQDPGLNIAMYNNKKVDNILDIIQKTPLKQERLEKYIDLAEEFESTIPAILIYAPKYLYVTSSKFNNFSLNNITTPSDRFNFIHQWSTRVDRVWKIFTN
jgi:peptide/nickel transport system substrate-binding protein